MVKNMARLDKNNVVINIECHPDGAIETEILVNMNDYPVSIGDIYKDGVFYRNGELLLTEIDSLYLIINEYEIKEEELNSSYQEGINSI